MNKNRLVFLGAVAVLAFALAPRPALCEQSSGTGETWLAAQEAERAQHEVQAALAKAQAEIAQAVEEVKHKTTVHLKLRKELAAKLAAHRGVMLAELQARKAELAALAQEKAYRGVAPLLALEEAEEGWLGVQIADVDAQKVKELKLPAERGVLVSEVDAESPAAKGGLKANDVITECNGQRIESATQFRRMVREMIAGRSVQLSIWREGRAQTVTVTLGSRRDRAESAIRIFGPRDFNFEFSMPEIFSATRTPLLGINAEDISGQLGAYFGAPGGEGILVREVNSGSAAEKAGMKAGDVITKVDGDRVRSLSELREKLRAKREQKTVSVGVLRKGAEVSLNVEIEQPRPPERRRIARRLTL